MYLLIYQAPNGEWHFKPFVLAGDAASWANIQDYAQWYVVPCSECKQHVPVERVISKGK